MVFWQNHSGDPWDCWVEASSGGAGLLGQQALHPDQMADLALGTKQRSRSGQGGGGVAIGWPVGGGAALASKPRALSSLSELLALHSP